MMLVYIWSRRNPYIRMNFFGLLNFQVFPKIHLQLYTLLMLYLLAAHLLAKLILVTKMNAGILHRPGFQLINLCYDSGIVFMLKFCCAMTFTAPLIIHFLLCNKSTTYAI